MSAGQARQLIGKPDALDLARQIIDGKLPVREVEALVQMREGRTPKATKRRAKVAKDSDTVALEERLSNSLGLDVAIDHRSPGGTVHIRYSDLEQLDEIVKRLGGTN